MKSFRSIVQEATKPKSRVLLFGRMNPITKGHEENVEAAHKIATKHGGDLHVIASHSHDAKKNPLSPEQKMTHLKRAFGHLSNTHVGTSSKEEPTILHQASKAHAAGVKHLIIAGGGDRAAGYHKLLHDYNGVEGKGHGYYKFDKISIENTGERKEGVSGTDMRKHAAAGHFDKFKAGLPSKIAGNEKHAQEMFHHVRSGMGVKEDTRDNYVNGNRLRLGESVVDTFTGMSGRIVYRGPTYVTVQIDEDTSFKRWIDDVDSIDVPNTADSYSFRDFVVEARPADVQQTLLNRVVYCPRAVEKFRVLLDDDTKDQGIVIHALNNTSAYLGIEKRADEMPGTMDDHALTEFIVNMRHAAQLLDKLGVLKEHEAYMEQHAHHIMGLLSQSADAEPVKEAKDIDYQGHMDVDEKTLREIEAHIDQMEDEDIHHIIHGKGQKEDQGGDTVDEELELDEKLNTQQRIQKRFNFIKSKSKREIAARLQRNRASTSDRLKKKAISAAKRLIASRLLRGRNKSQLSSDEKNRIEGLLKSSKKAVIRISNRLITRIRSAEAKRLSHHVKEDSIPAALQTTVKVQDTADKLAGNVSQNNPTDNHNYAKGLKRLKQFRKMEN